MIKKIFYSPIFWICFFIAALTCAILTWKLFPRAFPIVHLSITLDRSQALNKAQAIAQHYKIGPSSYCQAIQFVTDSTAKTFIELDAGGISALTNMIDNNLYQPYAWHVRHFKEFDTHELIIRFTPDGRFYGFVETIGEHVAGAQLTSKKAQEIAERDATQRWFITLKPYQLIETSHEKRESGRVDHTFVYERNDATIGAGSYRLRLKVSGDALTEITYFLKIPEKFLFTFKEMRSSNESVASGATMLLLVLYIFGGCIAGLIYAAHQRFILWRKPLLWGCIIAFLNLCAGFNEMPLMWMHYDTALPAQGFLFTYALQLILQFFAHVGSITLFIMAAETLGRKAFGDHLQLFKTWKTSVASSWQVVGQSVAGYLLVPFDFVFLVIFYLCTRALFGWWVPADEIVNPNVLATYFPSISALAPSLMAGFQEECLFRAVPLASAALLGERFGKRNLFIGCAFILQAFIFGAAHANYAAQPCYARLIELLVPSWIFGALYLAFGLIPGIILHVIIDMTWFSLPIFVATSWHACIHKIIVIGASSIPLFVLIYSRLKHRWANAALSAYNKSWKPEDKIISESQPSHEHQSITMSKQWIARATLVTIFGLCAIYGLMPKKQYAQPLTISRKEAIARARQLMRTINKNEKVRTYLATIYATFNVNPEEKMEHRFIWQNNKDAYSVLMGNYLTPPNWLIRNVQFKGTVEERTEEFTVRFAHTGSVYQQTHKIAETIAAQSLSQEDAQALARGTIEKQLALKHADLVDITATPVKLPHRTDWVFVFADRSPPELNHAEKRITVEITGNTIATIHRSIHVPEEWQRKERSRQHFAHIASVIATFLVYIISMLALVLVLQARRKFPYALSCSISLALVAFFLCSIANAYPELIATFTTAEPFSHQLFSSLGMLIIFAVAKAVMLGTLIAFITRYQLSRTIDARLQALLLGVYGGIVLTAIMTMVKYFEPSLHPRWAHFEPLAGYFPILAIMTITLSKFVMISTVLLLFSLASDQLIIKVKKPLLKYVAGAIIGAILLIGSGSMDSCIFAMLAGSILGTCWVLLQDFITGNDYSLIPITVATLCLFDLIQEMIFYAFPGVILGSIVASIATFLIAYIWFRALRERSTAPSL